MGELIFNGIMLVFFVAMTIYSGSIEIWQGYSGALLADGPAGNRRSDLPAENL